MNLSKMCMITVLTDASLESEIRAKLITWGALKCHVTESRIVDSLNEEPHIVETRQIRLESVCDSGAAQEILHRLEQDYPSNKLVTFYVSHVLTSVSGRGRPSVLSSTNSPHEQRWGDYLITI